MVEKVTHHALDRFAERVEPELLFLGRERLRDLLRERANHHALLVRNVRDRRCPLTLTTLVLVDGQHEMVIVVRDKTAVTVLDPWMADHNHQGWRTSIM